MSSTLACRVAAELGDRSAELSAGWRRRTRIAPAAAAGAGHTSLESAPARRGEPEGGAILVRALARALADQVTWRDDVMRAGWQMGTDAHARQGSLHHLLRSFDVLGDVLLRTAGESLASHAEGSAADGIEVARRLAGAVSLLRLAATRGYMQALMDTLRDRFRMIRHDIRNPLGTIRNAVALMDDETLPVETRASPRVRAMVARNARSIDDMLRTTLGDAAAVLPAFSDQPSTLVAVACSVRNELAGEASRHGIEIIVGDSLPGSLVDSAGIELALTSVILAMLRRPPEGADGSAELVIELAEAEPERAALGVEWRGGHGPAPDPADLAFARELSERSGGAVWADGGRVCVRVPLVTAPPAADERVPSAGEQGSHLAGARQGADLETGTR